VRTGIQNIEEKLKPVGAKGLLIEATLASMENDINSNRNVTKKKWRRKIYIKEKE